MKKFAPLFVIVAAGLWGIDGIVLRPELFTLPVPLVVFVESAVTSILLSFFFLKHLRAGTLHFKLRDWIVFAGVAFTGGAVGTMAITKALFYVNYVNLSVVVLIQKLQPVFALIFAAVWLREKLPKIFFLWSTAAIIGAYIMTFGSELPNFNTGDKTHIAALLSLAAAVSFAASTVLSKRALKNVDFEMGTYLRFIFSTGIMLLIVLGTGDISSISKVSTHQFFIFLIIAFSTGGTAIFLYYYGLKHITASSATIFELSFPVTAIILEYLIRDHLLSIIQWFGVIILIYSIFKVSKLSLKNGT